MFFPTFHYKTQKNEFYLLDDKNWDDKYDSQIQQLTWTFTLTLSAYYKVRTLE